MVTTSPTRIGRSNRMIRPLMKFACSSNQCDHQNQPDVRQGDRDQALFPVDDRNREARPRKLRKQITRVPWSGSPAVRAPGRCP
jgi:hypothetical protein